MNSELSLGPFCNWFLPSCSDIWSGPGPSLGQHLILFAYGERSSLCLSHINQTDKSIKLIDCIKIFQHKSNVSSTKFAKSSKNPLLFIGSSDGDIALLDCSSRKLNYQRHQDNNMPPRKISAVDWFDEQTVYYAIEEMLIGWNISDGSANHLKIPGYYDEKIPISVLACSSKANDLIAVG